MPTQPQKRKINPLAIIAIILILLALGTLFLIFAPRTADEMGADDG